MVIRTFLENQGAFIGHVWLSQAGDYYRLTDDLPEFDASSKGLLGAWRENQIDKILTEMHSTAIRQNIPCSLLRDALQFKIVARSR